MERVKGIEPSCAAWKAAVLPLNYTRPLWTHGAGRAGASCARAARQDRIGTSTGSGPAAQSCCPPLTRLR